MLNARPAKTLAIVRVICANKHFQTANPIPANHPVVVAGLSMNGDAPMLVSDGFVAGLVPAVLGDDRHGDGGVQKIH